MKGLSVSDVVNVTIVMSPKAVPLRNFGALLILGSSNVIDTNERLREYTSLDGVGADFSTTSPEYLAADAFFSQSPQPNQLFIGRWAETATSGVLHGAVTPSNAQAALLTSLQAINSGGMTISIDGTPHTVAAIDFSGITNLNGAASLIAAALTQANVVWNATYGRFDITSKTSGTSSTVSYATPPASGSDISALLGLTQASGASAPVAGIAAESADAAVQTLLSYDWYGLMFAVAPADANLTPAEYIKVAQMIEGASPSRIFGITTQDVATLDATSTTDLAYQLSQLNLERTFIQYSSSSPYAVASLYGRAFTVDFTANNSMITLKFKQEPGIAAETLNETQAATLQAKNCNVFVNYNNSAAIIQEGVMTNGYFFDEVQGTDWLQNQVQTDVWNLLYTSPTKIPQTDQGINQIVTTVEAALDKGVNNGLIAPGIWNSTLTFGTLKTGQMLTKGYYTYAASVNTQDQATREQRIAPTTQCAIKLAGAVHKANVIVNVNR